MRSCSGGDVKTSENKHGERCPWCKSRIVHPRVYVYECGNKNCVFAYKIEPEKGAIIKYNKKLEA